MAGLSPILGKPSQSNSAAKEPRYLGKHCLKLVGGRPPEYFVRSGFHSMRIARCMSAGVPYKMTIHVTVHRKSDSCPSNRCLTLPCQGGIARP